MKSLKKDLNELVKDLNAIAVRVEKLSGKLAETEKATKPKAKRGRPRGAAKKVTGAEAGEYLKGTVVDTVFKIIKRRKKGVDTLQIVEKTGFDAKAIWNAIFKLKKDGKVESIRKGVYGAR